MKQTTLLVFIIAILVISITVGIQHAEASKLLVTWVAPTARADGTPLTNLAGFKVEWGSCNADNSFGTAQASLTITNPAATSSPIYPTGLTLVCAHVFAFDTDGLYSVASNPAFRVPPPTLSKPTH